MFHNGLDQERVDREGEVWQELIYTDNVYDFDMSYENDEVETIMACSLLVLDLQNERVETLA